MTSLRPVLRHAVILVLCCLLVSCIKAHASDQEETRLRARELGIVVGTYPTGPLNAITDVAGVKVGHTTLISGEGPLKPGLGPIRTGVTVVIPREDVWHRKVPAGSFVLNGTGEMTGLAWVSEAGFLEYPIALTNTLNVPRVANGVMTWMIGQYPEIGITDDTLTPVVAECDDGRLNDIQGRHVSEADVIKALTGATEGPVKEGTVGAGTGMVSYGFKGGIGSASRKLPNEEGGYTVGVLVNANHGRKPELVVSGIPVGRLYDTSGPATHSSWPKRGLHYYRRRDRCAARWKATDQARQAGRIGVGPNRLDGPPWQRRLYHRLLHRQRDPALSKRADVYPDAPRGYAHQPSHHHDGRSDGRGDHQRIDHGDDGGRTR